ncbi:MAG: hypothetical protein WAN04_03045, partial [Candidatus Udaeobacter sp.]
HMKSPTLLAHDHSELDALLAAAFSALAAGCDRAKLWDGDLWPKTGAGFLLWFATGTRNNRLVSSRHPLSALYL